jgi:hypothetical protein
MTKRQAIAEVRDCADAIIEQAERRAKGWDRGAWRDDERIVDRSSRNTIAARIGVNVSRAFYLSAQFQD